MIASASHTTLTLAQASRQHRVDADGAANYIASQGRTGNFLPVRRIGQGRGVIARESSARQSRATQGRAGQGKADPAAG